MNLYEQTKSEKPFPFYGTVRLFRLLALRRKQPDFRWWEWLMPAILLPLSLLSDLVALPWDIRGDDTPRREQP
jgi:hypothetical protein